jgi:N-acyl-D-aspartate/D-glutamate deacylase
VSILLGFQTFHPLNFTPSWGASGIGLLPWDEQAARLRDDAELRARILTEARALEDDPLVMGFMRPDRVFVLGDPPDYEPPASRSVTAIAAARNEGVWETFLDLLLVDGGRELLNSPVLNYTDGNLDPVRTMLLHPTSAFGLGDGGAHAGQTCDASTTTFLLTHWVRDRAGERLPLELAVQKLTSATASLYGLGDRGALVPGLVGDVNLIDFDGLQLRRPEMVADLPGGARRFVQRAEGYVATVKSGDLTFEHGEDTGARPGVLVRGAR